MGGIHGFSLIVWDSWREGVGVNNVVVMRHLSPASQHTRRCKSCRERTRLCIGHWASSFWVTGKGWVVWGQYIGSST